MIVLMSGVAIIIIGVLFQYVLVKKDEKIMNLKGRLVNIGHTKLHLYGEGKASPTVVFDSGHGVTLSVTDWSLVQPEIATVARTIVYDRAGMGMSGKSRKPRTSAQIVEELHLLLKNAGEKPPYILVGHSFGALTMCLYANRYPDQVAGIVLVDGGSVDSYRKYFKPFTVFMLSSILTMSVILNKLGVFRLSGKMGLIPHIKERHRLLSQTNSRLDEAYFYKHYANCSMLREAMQLNRSVEQVSEVTSLGRIPLVVITAGKTEKVYKGWVQSQKTLLDLSENNTHIIVENSGHFVHLEHPEVVNEAIKTMINNLVFSVK